MADFKAGEPFGLDAGVLAKIDWGLALKRVINDVRSDFIYGFQSDWDEDSEDGDEEESLELKATTMLFDSLDEYPGQEENIERFCLPLFSKAGSDYAVKHVMDAFRKRPAMSQIYASYLAKFLSDDSVSKFLISLLKDESLVDWQKMWALAALSQLAKAEDNSVKIATTVLKDGDRHETLRAVAAVFVGRFGDHQRRKALVTRLSPPYPCHDNPPCRTELKSLPPHPRCRSIGKPMTRAQQTRGSETTDPFNTFSEWSGEADEKACASL